MKILGLIGFGYNPAAALVVDGKLIAFVEEERMINFKGAYEMFPGFAAKWCLQKAGLSLDDIDYIAWGWYNPAYRLKVPLFFTSQFFKYGFLRKGDGAIQEVISEKILQYLPGTVKTKLRDGLRRVGLKGRIPPIKFIEHHEAHVASSYLMSGFDEAAVLVIDGSGELSCTSIWHAKDGKFTLKKALNMPHSLGWFYAGMTDYLGFIPYRDEGKVMGLAPYGKKDPELEDKIANIIKITPDGYKLDPSYFLLGTHDAGKHFSDKMVKLFGPPRYYGEPLTDRTRDIAFAVQGTLERVVLNIVKEATDNGRIRNICVAGGVGLNCKMNGTIKHSPYVDKIFVQPASSDAGTAMGAAVLLSHRLGEWRPHRLKNVYYGPSFSDAEIKKELDIAGVKYSTPDNMAASIAKAISEGKIVAHFDGALEFGARALGHRSILANPCDPEMKDKVNIRVKFREPWRPFCPSLMAEHKEDYLEDADDAEFMIVAYQAKKGINTLLPSIVHVDNSVRPQTVERDFNPRYWEMLHELKSLTGHPVVMNTSFNLRGQPMIAHPRDAIGCFFTNGLDVLVLNNYWIEKKF
ncbi:MAG: carbamoyltransferase C-terminal domain-containing protein [Nitrospirota bacterium]